MRRTIPLYLCAGCGLIYFEPRKRAMPNAAQIEAIERNSLCSTRAESKQAASMATDPSIGERALNLHTYAWEDATVVCCTGRLTTETSQLLKTEVKVLLP